MLCIERGANGVSLLEKRAGIVEGMTPRMAEIVTYYDSLVPSRESEKLMDLAGLRGLRRAALEKKAGLVGGYIFEIMDDLLSHARDEQALPKGATMVSIGMDRVNVPYEEPNPEGEKSERTQRLRQKKPYQRAVPDPIVRAFRGDFIGSVSFYDRHGEKIAGYSYGLSHTEAPQRLADWLVADVVAALQQQPNLSISVCQDGARELWPTTWEALNARTELDDVMVHACIDFHHFIPRVHKAVDALWGEDECSSWEQRILNESNAVLALEDAILEELCWRSEEEFYSEAMEPVHNFLTYIEERTRVDGREDRRSELFDYAHFRELGLPIGSGATEATCKNLANVRMKRSGDRWGVAGAKATLTCRGLALSTGRWEIVWPYFAKHYVCEVVPLQIATSIAESDLAA